MGTFTKRTRPDCKLRNCLNQDWLFMINTLILRHPDLKSIYTDIIIHALEFCFDKQALDDINSDWFRKEYADYCDLGINYK